MSDTETREGGCWCGAVRYRVNEPIAAVRYCHCFQCVRTHGHFVAYVSVPHADFELRKDGGLKWHRCSETARRAFCSECGSRLFWLADGEPDTIELTVGSLDHHDRLESDAHIFIADKLPYYEIGDGLPQKAQR